MNNRSLYNAVWRWHFYAGLIVLPFLILLATTGALYLFQSEITRVVYRSWEVLPRPAFHPRDAVQLIQASEDQIGGTVLQIVPPSAPDRSYLMIIRTPDGESRWAFVDPESGQLLGTTRFGGVMQLIRKIHSLQEFGSWASSLIEIAAGWAIVMVCTGVFLWWPRGQKGGVVTIRGRPAQRMFWRDLHAVTGAFAGSIILFLAVTGMPWSQFWGNRVQDWATYKGWGEPPPPVDAPPSWQLTSAVSPQMAANEHQHHLAMRGTLPWALERAAPPESRTNAAAPTPIEADRAIAIFRARGLDEPFTITLPDGPRGAYIGSNDPERVEDVRAIYLDQYAGDVIGDVRFADFGPAAKAIQWGIHVHQGRQYGPVNRYLMLAGCAAVLLLAVSSIVMWCKRRPAGSLGIPPAPEDPRQARFVFMALLAIGVIYPLVGASLIGFAILDRIVVGTFARPDR